MSAALEQPRSLGNQAAIYFESVRAAEQSHVRFVLADFALHAFLAGRRNIGRVTDYEIEFRARERRAKIADDELRRCPQALGVLRRDANGGLRDIGTDNARAGFEREC